MKYHKPKILLIDLDDAVYEHLADAGFNVHRGTYGRPYRHRVEKRKLALVSINVSLPNLPEQEVLFIDTASPEIDESPTHIEGQIPSDSGIWTSAPSGVINPRVVAMWETQSCVDRLIAHGGVVVAFLDRELVGHLYWYRDYHTSNRGAEKFPDLDNVAFSSHLGHEKMRYAFDSGREVRLLDNDMIFNAVLEDHLDAMSFNTTFDPVYTKHLNSDSHCKFIPLLINKYGAVVGGAVVVGKGLILLLPQFVRKTELISSLPSVS
jgi:hypothetical protein